LRTLRALFQDTLAAGGIVAVVVAGMITIMLATMFDHVKVVQKLLSHGASLRRRNPSAISSRLIVSVFRFFGGLFGKNQRQRV